MSGIAGIGKSRLSWEFAKYGDGLMQTFYLTGAGALRTGRA